MRPLVLALFLALPAAAQDFGLDGQDLAPLPDFSNQEIIEGGITVETLDVAPVRPRSVPVVRTAEAPGAVLRGLDKVTGAVTDVDLDVGGSARVGRLDVRLGACRYPVDNPSGDAFARLEIDAGGEAPAFAGWMVASAPALSALDHPSYDVWVIRCRMS